MKHSVQYEINRLVEKLTNEQLLDGSWNYPFETGITTDAYMIILLRTLEIDDEKLIQALVKRILSKQEENGVWKLFYDEEEGNLSETIVAYYALLYSGYLNENSMHLERPKQFILSNGGLEKGSMFLKIMLALTGQYPWPKRFPVPIETFLIPVSFPINFYDFSVYARANLTPIILLGNKKFQMKTDASPDLSNLYKQQRYEEDPIIEFNRKFEWQAFIKQLIQGLSSIVGKKDGLKKKSIEHAEQYMLTHLEPDGTFYSYFSSTFFMIFALMSIGYSKTHPTILKAVEGLKSMACEVEGELHIQYTTANVWNTSLIGYAMQEAGVSDEEEVIQRANNYLLTKQHYKFGDWVINNTNILPGGWGFSNINTINPDVDDTTASLRALLPMIMKHPQYLQVWNRGLHWTLSMQNEDGGWPAFERNVDKKLIRQLPVQGKELLLLDPSTADLTGRTLEFLCGSTNLNYDHPVIKRGIKWMENDQRKDGSWYGRWGICYIYGTWSALTGLRACGVSTQSNTIKKAVHWLESIQNDDGGWGESCYSDIYKRYIPLEESTLTHTAWALDSLIAVSSKPTRVIDHGIEYLIKNGNEQSWKTAYPKGQGMGRAFYIHYHSYRYIWPLLTLGHYKKKYL
ncbi:squalene--hopene cyclase [Bacillus solimangrovi]|uniref:Squalene--hopene cyclase n=1 Tax=Bacillus solimangrovi TaxID=1305675 RepID=A0A1E5LGR9_9BACI|nr:squalene--hopene cyclase [Bacillus solimangrovi]OEH93272.1 squalene--hopene cyclase [Bacillus solimangrovi]